MSLKFVVSLIVCFALTNVAAQVPSTGALLVLSKGDRTLSVVDPVHAQGGRHGALGSRPPRSRRLERTAASPTSRTTTAAATSSRRSISSSMKAAAADRPRSAARAARPRFRRRQAVVHGRGGQGDRELRPGGRKGRLGARHRTEPDPHDLRGAATSADGHVEHQFRDDDVHRQDNRGGGRWRDAVAAAAPQTDWDETGGSGRQGRRRIRRVARRQGNLGGQRAGRHRSRSSTSRPGG